MPNIPDHNDPEVKVSEAKVFRQKYYAVDDNDTGHRTDYPLHEARVEVMADENGVFIECREGRATEILSIPTPDLAVDVANYILGAYKLAAEPDELDSCIGLIKFLTPELQKRISHELWRLSNHITSPHGPVAAQGASELHAHLSHLANLLDLKMEPHPEYSKGYKPNYAEGL